MAHIDRLQRKMLLRRRQEAMSRSRGWFLRGICCSCLNVGVPFGWTVEPMVESLSVSHEMGKLQVWEYYVKATEQIDAQARRSGWWLNTLLVIRTTFNIILPAILALQNLGHLSIIIMWFTWALSLTVSLATGFIDLFSLRQNHEMFTRTTEYMKLEGWHFFTLTSRYAVFSNHEDALPTFIYRVAKIRKRLLDHQFPARRDQGNDSSAGSSAVAPDLDANSEKGARLRSAVMSSGYRARAPSPSPSPREEYPNRRTQLARVSSSPDGPPLPRRQAASTSIRSPAAVPASPRPAATTAAASPRPAATAAAASPRPAAAAAASPRPAAAAAARTRSLESTTISTLNLRKTSSPIGTDAAGAEGAAGAAGAAGAEGAASAASAASAAGAAGAASAAGADVQVGVFAGQREVDSACNASTTCQSPPPHSDSCDHSERSERSDRGYRPVLPAKTRTVVVADTGRIGSGVTEQAGASGEAAAKESTSFRASPSAISDSTENQRLLESTVRAREEMMSRINLYHRYAPSSESAEMHSGASMFMASSNRSDPFVDSVDAEDSTTGSSAGAETRRMIYRRRFLATARAEAETNGSERGTPSGSRRAFGSPSEGAPHAAARAEAEPNAEPRDAHRTDAEAINAAQHAETPSGHHRAWVTHLEEALKELLEEKYKLGRWYEERCFHIDAELHETRVWFEREHARAQEGRAERPHPEGVMKGFERGTPSGSQRAFGSPTEGARMRYEVRRRALLASRDDVERAHRERLADLRDRMESVESELARITAVSASPQWFDGSPRMDSEPARSETRGYSNLVSAVRELMAQGDAGLQAGGRSAAPASRRLAQRKTIDVLQAERTSLATDQPPSLAGAPRVPHPAAPPPTPQILSESGCSHSEGSLRDSASEATAQSRESTDTGGQHESAPAGACASCVESTEVRDDSGSTDLPLRNMSSEEVVVLIGTPRSAAEEREIVGRLAAVHGMTPSEAKGSEEDDAIGGEPEAGHEEDEAGHEKDEAVHEDDEATHDGQPDDGAMQIRVASERIEGGRPSSMRAGSAAPFASQLLRSRAPPGLGGERWSGRPTLPPGPAPPRALVRTASLHDTDDEETDEDAIRL